MWIAYTKDNEYTCGNVSEVAKIKNTDNIIITFEDGDTDIIKAVDILKIKAEY